MPDSRVPDCPPIILPLVDQGNRPLWSIMIPVYNCAAFLKETLESVLSQAMAPDQMQIEVVDDASTDADVEALVREIGRGRVGYFRQRINVGSLRNFETCLNRSRGQLVHLLHGDDRVLPGFYAKFTELFERFPQAGAAFCNHYAIDSTGGRTGVVSQEIENDGILNDFLLTIAGRQRTQYVAMVVKRSAYEHLGSFYGVTYGEDWEMWVRIANQYPIAYTPSLLAEYRSHTNSISSQKITSGQALNDLVFVINNISRYVPHSKRKKIRHKSMNTYARFELNEIFDKWKKTGNLKNLIINLHRVLKIYKSAQLYFFIVYLFSKKSMQRIRMNVNLNQQLVATPNIEKRWNWELTAQSKWWHLEINTIWTYRNLLVQLVRRDFLVSYQQTVLGPLWTILQPILTVFIYTLVFNKLVGISTGSTPPTLFYLSGIILWNFFNEVFSGTATTFVTNAELFSKVYFPRLIVPFSVISTQFFKTLIQLILLFILLIYYWLFHQSPLPSISWLVYIPISLLLTGSISLSLGLIFSVVTAKYRDLTNVSMLLIRMLMFVTPVIYPASIISEKYQWVIGLNPLTPAFELFRYSLLGEGSFTIYQLIFSFSCAFIFSLIGLFLFNKEKESLMDVI